MSLGVVQQYQGGIAMMQRSPGSNEAVVLSRLGFESEKASGRNTMDDTKRQAVHHHFDANRLEIGGPVHHQHRLSRSPSHRMVQQSAFMSPHRPVSNVPTSPNKDGLRVLFLDIDGVLCCNGVGELESDKLERLGKIARETGCKVCLSTNWRLSDDLRERLYAELDALGIDCIGTRLRSSSARDSRPQAPPAPPLRLCLRPRSGSTRASAQARRRTVASRATASPCALARSWHGCSSGISRRRGPRS